MLDLARAQTRIELTETLVSAITRFVQRKVIP